MKKESCFFLFAFLLILSFSLPLPETRENSSSTNQIYSFQGSKSDKVEKNNSSEKSPNQEVKAKRELEEKNKPIDIFVDLTALDKEKSRNQYSSYLSLNDIEEAVNEVRQTLKNLINVTNSDRTLTITETKLRENGFDGVDYYNKSLIEGIKTDLIILIRYSNDNDGMNSSIFAKPKIIQTNSDDKRPEAGIVILYPEFGLTQTNKKEYLKFLFLHEFTHILGFLPDNIQGLLLNENPEINRIKSGIHKKALKLDTNVVKYAKNYFGCENMKYLELEDQTNFEGLTNCHWEARLLLGEYMTSEPYFGDQVISEFTLYLLEDLGFYATNKYTGGLMRFGKKQRCIFLGYEVTTSPSQSDCLDSEKNPLSYNEFCKEINQQTCSSGRQSRTYCIQKVDTSIDTIYDRGWSTVGRRNADYCPVSDNLDDEDAIDHYVGNCQLGSPKYGSFIYYDLDSQRHDSSIFDESVGQNLTGNSFCALSSLVNTNDNRKNIYNGTIRPTCYPMFCSSKSLTIKIYQQYFVCPQEGGIMRITNYNGYIYCPEYNLICTGTTLCNNMFDCVDKKSVAKDDLNYTVSDDGAVIEGKKTDTNLEDSHQIVKGYELSDDDDSKCPQNCFECIENRRCFECNDKKTYYLTGTKEDDQEPIKCNETEPTDYYYKNSNYKIGGKTGLTVYFNCREGCKTCTNGNDCSICSPTHYLNSGSCKERIPNCKTYDSTSSSSVIQHSSDNNGGLAYTECEQCDKEKEYYCLNINGENDRKKCYHIENMNEYYKIVDKNVI